MGEVFRGRYHSCWSNLSKISTPIRVAPSESETSTFTPDTIEPIRRTAVMSTQKFARFVGILTENEEPRSALLQSGKSLTRIEHQRRMNRDEFWETIVAMVHNSPTLSCLLTLTGCWMPRTANMSLTQIFL